MIRKLQTELEDGTDTVHMRLWTLTERHYCSIGFSSGEPAGHSLLSTVESKMGEGVVVLVVSPDS